MEAAAKNLTPILLELGGQTHVQEDEVQSDVTLPGSSSALARRVRRVSAFPSRTSAIRSARMLGSRKPPRIMHPTRIACRDNGKPFFAYLRNRGILRPS